jgi:hypothetical protein
MAAHDSNPKNARSMRTIDARLNLRDGAMPGTVTTVMTYIPQIAIA